MRMPYTHRLTPVHAACNALADALPESRAAEHIGGSEMSAVDYPVGTPVVIRDTGAHGTIETHAPGCAGPLYDVRLSSGSRLQYVGSELQRRQPSDGQVFAALAGEQANEQQRTCDERIDERDDVA